jgi:hypothetical protein
MDTAGRKAKGSRSMGVNGSDVYITIPNKFPFGIEVKNQQANKLIYDWYDQAVSNTKCHDEPLLFIKRNQHRPLVVLDAEFFIKLYANK